MSEHPEVQAGPVVKVAQDLTAIQNMCAELDDQAEHKATARIDGTVLPGGFAMVALANVANLEAWERKYEFREHVGRDTTHILDEDDVWEPPLQTLCFWSEQWRAEHGNEYGMRPTVRTEAAYIKALLNWAWENELAWDDFAKDIKAARRRMENVLYSGERAEQGSPCLYDECKGARLSRKLEPCRDEQGGKSWRWTKWHCPRCKRKWSEDEYSRMLVAATEATKMEVIEGQVWCSVDYAARMIGRAESTIRVWVHRKAVSVVCVTAGRRSPFVNLDEVRERHDKSKRRNNAA